MLWSVGLCGMDSCHCVTAPGSTNVHAVGIAQCADGLNPLLLLIKSNEVVLQPSKEDTSF